MDQGYGIFPLLLGVWRPEGSVDQGYGIFPLLLGVWGVSGSGLWDFPAIIRRLEGLVDRIMGSAPTLFRPIPGGLAF